MLIGYARDSTIEEIVTKLQKRNIGFRSLTENIDTTSPAGKLIFHIFGSLAEFECDLIRERALAGLAAAGARGRKSGRPRVEGLNDEKKRALSCSLYNEKQNSIKTISKRSKSRGQRCIGMFQLKARHKGDSSKEKVCFRDTRREARQGTASQADGHKLNSAVV